MVQGMGFRDVAGRPSGLYRDAVSAAGQVAWGERGEFYRAFLFLNSDSQPKGHAVAYLTAGGSATAVTLASAGAGSTAPITAASAMPYIGTVTFASNTGALAGILAEDKIGPGVYWVQVGGPVALTINSSAASTTRAAAVAWVPSTVASQTANLSNARGSVAGATITRPEFATASSAGTAASTNFAIFQGAFAGAPPGLFNAAVLTVDTVTATRSFFLAGPDAHRQIGHIP